MSRYTGPSCRLCRRAGVKLFLKGNRCYSEKCAIARRNTIPGQHSHRRRKFSEYGLRLHEKQKLRRMYGMTERQFERFFENASRMAGQKGHNFIQLLERRLDNVVYRLGFASSRAQARQLVSHGHITVNGKRLDIPSALVKVGDVIGIASKSRDIPIIKENLEVASARTTPEWLELQAERMEGRVISLPTREQIDVPVNEQLIVEFYAR